jgi:hypothetical protein
VRKGKQLLEGLASGAAMSAALDMARVYKYASNFKKASPADRAKIVEALNLNAQEIGDSLGKTLVANGRAQGERLPGQMDALQFEVDNARKAEELKATFRAEQVQQRAVQAMNSQLVPFEQGPQVFSTPGVPQVEGQGLDMGQLMANQQMVGQSQEALPAGAEAAGMLPPGQTAGMLPGGPEARPPGAEPAGLLGEPGHPEDWPAAPEPPEDGTCGLLTPP